MTDKPSTRSRGGALGSDPYGRIDGHDPSQREKWLEGQNSAFKAAVNGAPLKNCLDVLISTAIEQVEGTAQCAFYLANAEGTELHHVAGMSEEYARQVEGFKIGPDSLACGLAVDMNSPVVTPDVREEPRWEPWLWLAEQANYRGVWSFPVETAPGKLVGTFAMYFEEPRSPTAHDLRFARSLCSTACIIIAQDQIRQAERAANQRLRDYADVLEAEERRQRYLLAELQHRVRNTLAVIRSLVRRTAASSDSVEDFELHLDGRLASFARTQVYATRDPEGSIDLELIVRDELLMHPTNGSQKISVKGPATRLDAKLAETMGLAIHELTTNAVKHGALGSDDSKVDVNWSVSGRGNSRKLHFSWRESLANRRIEKPTKTGFGTELLERVLSYELDAEPTIEYRPEGVSYQVAIPLP